MSTPSTPLHTTAPIIELEDVHKAFGDLRVLRGVDLQVERGKTLVILGESGSGKTVLMKLMIGLLTPDRGMVRVNGVDLATLDDDALARARHQFGMVFQGSALFDSMSVFENVAFPLRERFPHLDPAEISNRVHEKLNLFDLGGVDGRMPEELSGGMRKRVGLARAIVLNPQILLYDEPMTGLDPIMSESVAQMIIRAKRALGVTGVVVCHDLASAFEMADDMAFLHGGRIIEHGTAEQIRASRDPDLHRFLSLWEETRAAAR